MKPIVSVPLKYGAIAGVLGGILLLVLYYLGRHPMLISIIFDFRIFLFGVFIFFVLRELRDYYGGGLLSFGEGMMSSFIFVTVFGVIAGGTIILFSEMEEEFVRSFVTQFTEQVKGLSEQDIKQLGKENLERNLKALPATNGYNFAWNYFKQGYWIGLFISIILAVVLRRQPKL